MPSPAMEFAADNSSRFPFRARTQAHRQTNKVTHVTDSLPTHRLPLAWVINSLINQSL